MQLVLQSQLLFQSILLVLQEVSDELIIQLVREHFDLRPFGITRMLNLIQPMYKTNSCFTATLVVRFRYCIYMGKTDKVEALKDAAGL